MCKEVRGIARHRFLRFLVEKGSKKANEFEGSITFPESNGSRVLHPHNWVAFSISQSKEGNRLTLGPVQKKRLPETDQTRSTFECDKNPLQQLRHCCQPCAQRRETEGFWILLLGALRARRVGLV